MAGHNLCNVMRGHLERRERPEYLHPVDADGHYLWKQQEQQEQQQAPAQKRRACMEDNEEAGGRARKKANGGRTKTRGTKEVE